MQHPPAKRRKFSSHMQHSRWIELRAVVEDQPRAFAHDVEPLEEAKLAQEAVRAIANRKLLPRQDTAMSTAITTATLASSSASSGSMTSVPTTSAITNSIAIANEPTTSEATASTSNAALALSVLLSVSISLPLSDIASAATGLPVSVVSGVLSDVSSLLVPSETSSSSSSPPPNETAPASTSGLGNDTSSASSSVGMSRSNNSTSMLLPASTSTGFLTSSFSRNSTTTTSQTSSSSRVESSSTESTLGFIATLSQGDVTNLSRSADAYTTTLDGSILTVSAAETSLTQASKTASFTSSFYSSSVAPIASTDGGDSRTLTAPNSTESASSSDSSGSSTPPAGTIAGGVVGGAAGLALVALIAMLAVRWYRRKGAARHQALSQGPGHSSDPKPLSPSGPGMAERAGLAPLAAAAPALSRYQNRAAGSEATTQRGFTRVSGRKLPSAFSGGVRSQSSPDGPVNREAAEPDLNETSFYRDSSGFFGGSGSPPSPTGSFPLRSDSYEHMTISPGPQRIPRLHSGGPYDMSPESAGRSSPQVPSALTRSDAPFLLDPNRNSRFSEGL